MNTTTKKTTPRPPQAPPTPHTGGRYVRAADGSLQRASEQQPKADEANTNTTKE